jgi:hypothetical protein
MAEFGGAREGAGIRNRNDILQFLKCHMRAFVSIFSIAGLRYVLLDIRRRRCFDLLAWIFRTESGFFIGSLNAYENFELLAKQIRTTA